MLIIQAQVLSCAFVVTHSSKILHDPHHILLSDCSLVLHYSMIRLIDFYISLILADTTDLALLIPMNPNTLS